jgi:hypothetical protein
MLGLGVVVAGLVVAGGLLLPSAGPDDSPERQAVARPSGGEPVVPSGRTAALAVLRAWDRARAAAWREGDVRALGRLYTTGSAAGRADRRLLAAYVDRGLRVTGMRMQVASVEVRDTTDDRIRLLVIDRLVDATARGGPVPVELPRDGWSRHRVVLVRVGGLWRVSRVSDQARPAASTAATSGSWNR